MLCTAGEVERSCFAKFCEFLEKICVLSASAMFRVGYVSQSSICAREFQNIPQLNSMGHILTIYSKIKITIITKLLRWDHRVVHNVLAKL